MCETTPEAYIDGLFRLKGYYWDFLGPYSQPDTCTSSWVSFPREGEAFLDSSYIYILSDATHSNLFAFKLGGNKKKERRKWSLISRSRTFPFLGHVWVSRTGGAVLTFHLFVSHVFFPLTMAYITQQQDGQNISQSCGLCSQPPG